MKYFGTDGIRGKACSIWFDKVVVKMAKALVKYYNKNKLKKEILIGNDSRISADFVMSKLASILLKNGIVLLMHRWTIYLRINLLMLLIFVSQADCMHTLL